MRRRFRLRRFLCHLFCKCRLISVVRSTRIFTGRIVLSNDELAGFFFLKLPKRLLQRSFKQRRIVNFILSARTDTAGEPHGEKNAEDEENSSSSHLLSHHSSHSFPHFFSSISSPTSPTHPWFRHARTSACDRTDTNSCRIERRIGRREVPKSKRPPFASCCFPNFLPRRLGESQSL